MKKGMDMGTCLSIPKKWKRCYNDYTIIEPTEGPNPPRASKPKSYSHWTDPAVFHASLFMREFLSTMCLILLQSRLGGSLFIAGPVVIFYVNIVFRRPLYNPFVLPFACFSAGDWKKATVAGYPGFKSGETAGYKLAAYYTELLIAQLLGATAAAYIKASYANTIGSEFIADSAWGINQMYLKVKEGSTSSCWNTAQVPVRLFGANTSQHLLDACISKIGFEWWFLEDLCAVFFLIVAYMHLWKWLRWDDEEAGNPSCDKQIYWAKIVAFSMVSAGLNLSTSIAFPTAHAGLHTSMYIFTYQSLRDDLNITVNAMYEPLIRAGGGAAGCFLALLYEQMLARYFKGKRTEIDILVFKILYQNTHMQ